MYDGSLLRVLNAAGRGRAAREEEFFHCEFFHCERRL
jgi:hypothetical protein